MPAQSAKRNRLIRSVLELAAGRCLRHPRSAGTPVVNFSLIGPGVSLHFQQTTASQRIFRRQQLRG